MTIEILGDMKSVEYSAAVELKKIFSSFFRAEDSITIIAGVQCFGQRYQDIDLLVLGVCPYGLKISPELFTEEFRDKQAHLLNFAVTIEIKDHSGERVRFHSGNHVDVYYKNKGWSCASTQAFNQKYSVLDFLKSHRISPPYIASSLWLRNVSRAMLPNGRHNLFSKDLDCNDFLRFLILENSVMLERQKNSDKSHYAVSFTGRNNAYAVKDSAEIFRKKIQASPLDRRKVELICKRVVDEQGYAKKLGKQLLMFRGRGGSGKTIRLLQIAMDLHDDNDARVLFLTYNKALVADVTRLFAIRGVTNRLGERTVKIQSSTEYFFRMLKAWDMQPKSGSSGEFPESEYKHSKRELIKLLQLSSPQDLEKDDRTFCDNPGVFMWDYILIDEGQDWPTDERDLLYSVFGPEKIIVADGVDQFVQNQSHCNWRDKSQVKTENSQIVSLRKSLRLKSNLCRFVQSFAQQMGIEWDMDVNEDVSGGRIIVLEGEYSKEAHQRVMEGHVKNKNTPIDTLMCVTGSSGSASLGLPEQLREWGYRVWDGLDSSGRDAFPTKTDQYRVVKYESCRGLEGWTVVCLDFDLFIERQHEEGERTGPQSLLESKDEAADRFAARWGLIPLTRAIDTLVIQISGTSEISDMIHELAEMHSDFIEIWS